MTKKQCSFIYISQLIWWTWHTRVLLIWHIFVTCLDKYMEQNSIDDVRMDKVPWPKIRSAFKGGKNQKSEVHRNNYLKKGQSDGVAVTRRASRGRKRVIRDDGGDDGEGAQWFKPRPLCNLVVLKPSLAGIDRECPHTCELWWVRVHWVLLLLLLLIFHGSNIFTSCFLLFAFLHPILTIIIIIVNFLSLSL